MSDQILCRKGIHKKTGPGRCLKCKNQSRRNTRQNAKLKKAEIDKAKLAMMSTSRLETYFKNSTAHQHALTIRLKLEEHNLNEAMSVMQKRTERVQHVKALIDAATKEIEYANFLLKARNSQSKAAEPEQFVILRERVTNGNMTEDEADVIAKEILELKALGRSNSVTQAHMNARIKFLMGEELSVEEQAAFND